MAAPDEVLERILAQPLTYIKDKQSRAEQGISRTFEREQEADGLQPLSVQLGERSRRKIRREVDALRHARAVGADDDQVRSLLRRLVEARAEIPAPLPRLKVAA